MTIDMTKGSVWKKLMLFFLPLLVTSILQHLYSTVDAIIVGQMLGKTGLAAIDAISEFARMPVNFALGLASGATVLISREFGAKRYGRLADIARSGILLALMVGLFFSAGAFLLADPVMVWLKVPADIVADSYTYLRIYFMGMVFNLLYNMGAGIMRAVGNSKTPMVILAISGAANILLDLLFVGPFGMGIAGAAVATVAAQMLSALLALLYLFRQKAEAAVSIRTGRASLATALTVIRIGLPAAIRSAMWPFANTIIHTSINALGTEVITAWAVNKKMDILLWLSIDALGPSVMTFTAQNHGARDLKRARAGARVGIVAGLIIMTAFSTVLYVFPEALGSIFVNQAGWDVLPLVGQISRWQAPFYFIYTFGCILTNAISGYGDTLGSLLIIMIGTCGFRIAWILLYVSAHPDIHSIILAYILAYVVTAALSVSYYFGRTLPRLKKEHSAAGLPETP